MTRFPDTRGSLVAALTAGAAATRARALETLAEAYWAPLYAYVRFKTGRPHEEAADLIQELFVALVEKDWLSRFDASRARLRTYLRVLLDGLAANERKAASREKRGGALRFLSLDVEAVRREAEESLSSTALSPEDFYEREWARGVFSAAVRRLREACVSSGHALRFELFSAYDLEGGAEVPRPRYGDLAERFGTTAVDVTNQLAAARRDFRRVVLDLLRELTASDEEFRAEARALLGTEPPA